MSVVLDGQSISTKHINARIHQCYILGLTFILLCEWHPDVMISKIMISWGPNVYNRPYRFSNEEGSVPEPSVISFFYTLILPNCKNIGE